MPEAASASGPPLEILGAPHLSTLGVLLALAVAVPLWARRLPAESQQSLARGLAVVLVGYRIGWTTLQTGVFGRPLKDVLPLHICGLLFFLCGYMLWTRSYAVWEVAYFWGMGGSLQAMLTPDSQFGFPHPSYLQTLIAHSLLILAVLYAAFVFEYRPTVASTFRALAATLAYAAVLSPVNLMLHTNYMYLRHKPAGASLLDFLGPWPWYVLAAVGVAFVSYWLWYLPFLLARRRTKRSGA